MYNCVSSPHRGRGRPETDMKPHIILHLRRGVRLPPIRAWVDAVKNMSGIALSLTPALDALFRRHRLPGWVLSEYPPPTGVAGSDRTGGEACGVLRNRSFVETVGVSSIALGRNGSS